MSAADFVGKDPSLTAVGGLAVAVPGELRGLEALHTKYGKLPWARLLQPAIQLARDGYPFSRDCVRVRLSPRFTQRDVLMRRDQVISKQLPPGSTDLADSWVHKHPVLAGQITNGDGTFLPFGSLVRRPEFADTLEIIAEKGVDAFYDGPIAESMVDAVRAQGGKINLEDFKSARNFDFG